MAGDVCRNQSTVGMGISNDNANARNKTSGIFNASDITMSLPAPDTTITQNLRKIESRLNVGEIRDEWMVRVPLHAHTSARHVRALRNPRGAIPLELAGRC